MRIWLDLDEVLCSLVKPLEKKEDFPLSYENITNYNLREITNLTKEEAVNLFASVIYEDYEKNHEILTPLPYTVDTVKKLKSKADKIYVITARPELLKEQTYSWLNRYFPGLIDDVIFTNKHLDIKIWDKEDVLKKLEISLFVDDNLKNVLWAQKAWVKYIFLQSRPWNQGNVEWIKRIDNLKEILTHIK